MSCCAVPGASHELLRGARASHELLRRARASHEPVSPELVSPEMSMQKLERVMRAGWSAITKLKEPPESQRAGRIVAGCADVPGAQPDRNRRSGEGARAGREALPRSGRQRTSRSRRSCRLG